MSVTEIKRLPLREKFQILEVLWEDLSDHIADIPVSKVDRELLDARLERIDSGETEIHDWDEVKHSIGRR